MMMSKPAPESSAEQTAPAFAKPPEVKQKPQSAVEDLERRLALLGGDEQKQAPPALVDLPPPSVSAPPAVTAPAAVSEASSTVKGGKNALLARIMAAKERTQQAQTKTEVPTAVEPPKHEDLLTGFDAPSSEKDPPPSYDTNFLQPPPAPTVAEMPPPAFTSVQNNLHSMEFPAPPPIDSLAVAPPPPIESLAPPPPIESLAPPFPSAPLASAPAFEDLLDSQHQTNPLSTVEAVPPPTQAPPAMEIEEDILAALDPAEREALLEEQKKIMEQIEKEKANNEASGAAARAMAFDQRSSAAVARVAASYDSPSVAQAPAPRAAPSRPRNARGGDATVDLGSGEQVPLHGQERTQQAIKDGTAVVVQCVNCQNWMQVTESASLMFCPVCQVVSPVEKEGAATASDMENAAQMAADAQLAEKLQNEEYKKAGGSGERARSRRRPQQQQQGAAEDGQSWYDWFMGVPVKPDAVPSNSRSAEIRPTASRGLVAAQTGAEFGNSRSYDESEGLISSGPNGSRSGARMAEQKSMFSCVADSISTAAGQMTAYSLSDQEGNVHGVDSSSLLAMPNVSREREN